MKQKAIPVTVTFRHMAPTEALRAYAEKKLAGVAERVPGATEAHIVLSAQKHRHRQEAEVTVHGARNSVLVARGQTADLYEAIDFATDKLDNQIRKLKGRMIEAPRRGAAVARRGRAAAAPA